MATKQAYRKVKQRYTRTL